MKLKLAGVAVWIWAVGMAVALATVIAIRQAMADGNGKPKEVATLVTGAARKEKSSPVVENLGDAALQAIQLRSWTVDSVASDEMDLEKQTLPGKAALAAITLKESKERLAKDDVKVAAALEKLTEAEGAGGRLAGQLKEFLHYTEQVIHEHKRSLTYNGYSQETTELFTESLRIRSSRGDGVSLADVRRGRYKADVMLRIETKLQEQIESYRIKAN